jgi:hypothetical protein
MQKGIKGNLMRTQMIQMPVYTQPSLAIQPGTGKGKQNNSRNLPNNLRPVPTVPISKNAALLNTSIGAANLTFTSSNRF